jgi:hypothetical protein
MPSTLNDNQPDEQMCKVASLLAGVRFANPHAVVLV